MPVRHAYTDSALRRHLARGVALLLVLFVFADIASPVPCGEAVAGLRQVAVASGLAARGNNARAISPPAAKTSLGIVGRIGRLTNASRMLRASADGFGFRLLRRPRTKSAAGASRRRPAPFASSAQSFASSPPFLVLYASPGRVLHSPFRHRLFMRVRRPRPNAAAPRHRQRPAGTPGPRVTAAGQ